MNRPGILLALLAGLLYAGTLGHGYALDDKIVITENSFTKQGLAGIDDIFTNEGFVGFFGQKMLYVKGGRYRPLTQATYAAEFALFRPEGSPDTSAPTLRGAWKTMATVQHGVNALLYALLILLVFRVFQRIFPAEDGDGPPWATAAFITALLFAAHPLHVEVVANIKGRDDLLSAILGFAALALVLQTDRGGWRRDVAVFGTFLAGMFAKESTIVFLGVLPLTLYIFTDRSVRQMARDVAPAALAAALFLIVRQAVIGGLPEAAGTSSILNDPFALATNGERWATVAGMGLHALRMVVVPHPLTHDYYPWHPLTDIDAFQPGTSPYLDWSSPWVYVALLIYALLIATVVVGVIRKRPLAYAGALFLGGYVLYSNILFPIGAFLGERFLFLPSLGVCVAIGYVIGTRPVHPETLSRLRWVPLVVALVFAVLTIRRVPAWANDYTLFTTDVETSSGSAKAQMSAGGAFLARHEAGLPEGGLVRARTHLEHALTLHPSYQQAHVLIGKVAYYEGDYSGAATRFELAAQQDVRSTAGRDAIRNLRATGYKALESGDLQAAEQAFLAASPYLEEGDQAQILGELGRIAMERHGDVSLALDRIERGLQLAPGSVDLRLKKGTILATAGRLTEAETVFRSILTSAPANASAMRNLGITLIQQGRTAEGQALVERSQSLE